VTGGQILGPHTVYINSPLPPLDGQILHRALIMKLSVPSLTSSQCSDPQRLILSLPLFADWAYASLLPRQVGDPCATVAPCVSLNNADSACTDDACFCPAAVTLGPQCASCYATVNATLSSALATVVSICSAEGFGGAAPPVTSTHAPTTAASSRGSGADPCITNSACSSIFSAADACSDDACFCPTALALGSACSQCYATVNATLAADLSSAMVGCASEGFVATDAAITHSSSTVPANTVVITTITSTPTSSPTGTRSTSGASHDVFGFSPLFGVSLIVLVASMLTLFG